jgi:polysaccharide export outer membrane protein
MNLNNPEKEKNTMNAKKILFTALLISFLTVSYAYTAEVPQPPENPDKIISQTVEYEPLKYTLGPDDVIQIEVRRHPEFSGEYIINSEGKIQYKFVGDIPITGFTKVEAKEKLKTILSKYIIEPDIEITISQYRSKVIFIVGEVGAPGKYYMRADSISVRDAVVQAGLPTLAAAMRRTKLIHPAKSGKPGHEKMDLYKLIYEGKLDLDKEMLPGDVLYVPATMFAKVSRIINPVAAPISPATTIERAATGNITP